MYAAVGSWTPDVRFVRKDFHLNILLNRSKLMLYILCIFNVIIAKSGGIAKYHNKSQ